MKLLIGLVGEIGGGKGTFFTLLKEQTSQYTVVKIGFSDIIRETLTLWGLSHTRENLQKLPQAMDQWYGVGSLSHAIQKKAESKAEDVVMLDGVRWETDFEMIKGFPNNCLVYITAAPAVGFLRLRARAQNIGDANLNWDTFFEQEQAPNEMKIAHIGSRADYKIENNSSIEDYRNQVKDFCGKFLNQKPAA